MRVMRRSLVALAALAVSAFMSPAAAGDEQLCAVTPGSYAAAKAAHPEMAFAIAEVEQHGIATWYTDRGGNAAGTAQAIVSSCPSSSRLAIVVYGLPNKDCEARESMGGSNTNNAQYQSFVSTLQQTVGDRKVLYVLEPDAIALLAGGGCAKSYGYDASLAIAVRTLSQNPNADIYLDVGHWILGDSGKLGTVASIVRSLASNGRIKGVSINTSNYRSNAELSGLCANFRSATAGLNLHCIIDTSRNYNGPSTQSEWCNYKNAGIGKVPTGSTGDPNIDYYVWIKPPGESDGVCSSGHTGDAMVGPGAGAFFPEFFKSLWNEGALVKEKGMPKIDGTIRAVQTSPTPTPTPEVTTPTPTTPTPTNATTTQTTNSTSSEDRSMDTPTATTPTTGSQVGAGVVSAPQEDSSSNPVFANAPTSETPSATEIQEANTQSKAGGSMSAGIVVFACLIGAAVVALVAVVAVRVRQRSIEETKTPMEPLEPRIHYLSNTPSGLSTL